MLGWKTEHFLGFLTVTFIACFARPRPLPVGLALMATAGLLEALQGLAPDRIPDLPTALSGAARRATCICCGRNIRTGTKVMGWLRAPARCEPVKSTLLPRSIASSCVALLAALGEQFGASRCELHIRA